MNNTKEQKRVNIYDLSLYIRLIRVDFNPKNNKRLAELITSHFDVLCLEEDIEHYVEMHIEWEDYEKMSRMADNGNLENLIE